MDRFGILRERYYKHNLLPLGEHVPFSEEFPFLLDWIPDAGEFSPGPGAQALQLDGLRLTPLICYEILFPRYVREGLHLGGDVLLNLTNDYWFGRYAEPEQHLSLARMRAFETGRPILRATNTGYSALIAADGSIVTRSGLWQREILRGTLEIPEARSTPYLRAGEWMVVLLALVAWGLAAIQWRLVRRDRP
jgi:apolipoprotein N-acyltransferase